MEESFDKAEGVIDVISGYSGGTTKNPTYKEVTYGDTGHFEVVEVTYDSKITNFENLLSVFCKNIDTIRLFISKITGTELFSPEMYYLAKLPAEIDNYELLSVVTMALSFSILASIYPSWKASKIDPVEVLRNE